MRLRSLVPLVAFLAAGLGAPASAPQAAERDRGELLFAVKCGRCHGAVKLVEKHFAGLDADEVRRRLVRHLPAHFAANDAERRQIVDYLAGIAAPKPAK